MTLYCYRRITFYFNRHVSTIIYRSFLSDVAETTSGRILRTRAIFRYFSNGHAYYIILHFIRANDWNGTTLYVNSDGLNMWCEGDVRSGKVLSIKKIKNISIYFSLTVLTN